MNQEASPKGHPKGLYLLFFTEMWERFSYYGMRAIFTLYMIKALMYDKSESSQIYGWYTGLVYLTPLLGGYIADKYWGNRRSIFFGGILMAIGQFLMFLSASSQNPFLMYFGLGFLIFGNGFFKPNISTMVGRLYPEGDKRVDSAFSIFYMGINAGALIAPLVCGYLGEKIDFKWGFLAACIGMIISVTSFELFKNKYIITPDGQPIGAKPEKKSSKSIDSEIKSIENSGSSSRITIITLSTFVGLFSLFYFYLLQDLITSCMNAIVVAVPLGIILDPKLTKIEKQRIAVVYILAFFVIFFWSAFEQAGASLTYFASEQTDRFIFGWEMPASYFQMFNAGFIVLLAPVFVIIWGWLGKKRMEPASPTKQAFGLLFLAIGYLYIAFFVKGIEPHSKVTMIALIGLYFLHTIGELCLSPIGLSMVSRLSPVRLASLLMGVWFLSTATANNLAGILSKYYPEAASKAKAIKINDDALLSKVKSSSIDTAVWNLSPQETTKITIADTATKIGTEKTQLTVGEWAQKILTHEDFKAKRELADFLIKTDSQVAVSVYKLKYIKSIFEEGKDEFKHVYASRDGSLLYVEHNKKVDIWNLSPEKPKLFGNAINDLYGFFMIFVVMAGIASLILFLLSKKLLKMMHGLR